MRLQRFKHIPEAVEIEFHNSFTVRGFVPVAGVGQNTESAIEHMVLDVAVDLKSLLTGYRAVVMFDVAEIFRAG